ncbi:MAG: heme biosynthesis protein HemY [Nitratireductor sp.]
MFRILFYILLILALGAGFSWVADYPGTVKLDWQGNEYEASLLVVVAGLVACIAVVMFVWTIIRIVLNSPRIMNRFFKQRKKDRGYDALSQGLIAAGSGDAIAARRFSKESTKLLSNEPLVELLDAQTLLLEGDDEHAREKFESMLEDDRTKLIALRGLYLEAEKQGSKAAAKQYVEEAAALAPALPWAGNAMLRYRATQGDWDGALDALKANSSAGLVDKKDASRQRAVLLTAHAMSKEQRDPSGAVKLAKEAHKLAPDLVPTAVIGAKAYMRNNDLRRASNLIEAVWKKSPHPELAETYVHLRIGDSALDRLKRAKKLASLRANHAEGNIAIAEAAMEAQDFETARTAMKAVMTNAPTERACLIMADLEEAESGDKGRMRDWLARAVRAPKDAAWTVDNMVSEKWLPFSPNTGKIDAFEWKVPVEQLGQANAGVIEADDLAQLMEPLALEDDTPTDLVEISAEDLEALESASEDNAMREIDEVAEDEVPSKNWSSSSDDVNDENDESEAEDAGDQADDNKEADDVASEEVLEEEGGEAMSAKNSAKSVEASAKKDPSADTDSKVVFPLERRPDDPGVNESVDAQIKKRFGFF